MAYEFTQDAYREFSQAIIDAKGDQATITSVLADMQDTFNDNIGLLATTRKDNEGLTAENKRLKDANMDLFLRIGAQKEEINNQTGGREEPPKEQNVDEYMQRYFEKLGGK